MLKQSIIIFAIANAGVICVQAQPVGIEYVDPVIRPVMPHRAVLENAENEAQLPRELLKSPKFYDNPNVAAALAKDSWFGYKEMETRNREAEKIPRQKIYELLKHAGYTQDSEQ